MFIAKNKRGRPTKPKRERAGEILKLRLTTAELRDIRACAKRDGSTLSAFVRAKLKSSAGTEG